MKTADVDILVVPGWSDSGPDHWQSRWVRNLKTARRVEQENWAEPDREAWVGRIIDACVQSNRPAVIVAHSLGVAAVAHAAAHMPKGFLQGAFLVAPADVDNAEKWPKTRGLMLDPKETGFAPFPTKLLPFPSVVIGSQNDPYCAADRAQTLANCWGSAFTDAGEAGHINVDSGHGPWPDGLLRFSGFLRSLDQESKDVRLN